MSPELDQQLCERYPLIFKDRGYRTRKAPLIWGFEHGDGWFNLLDTLCGLLYEPYVRAQQDYAYARNNEGTAPWKGADVITAVEVERKRLAMKAAAEVIPTAIQVKEKFGTLRFYTTGCDDRAMTLIEFAEELSGKTCEVCGAPGQLRGGGWVKSLCDHHHEERERKMR